MGHGGLNFEIVRAVWPDMEGATMAVALKSIAVSTEA
jgi:hypothetical protein